MIPHKARKILRVSPLVTRLRDLVERFPKALAYGLTDMAHTDIILTTWSRLSLEASTAAVVDDGIDNTRDVATGPETLNAAITPASWCIIPRLLALGARLPEALREPLLDEAEPLDEAEEPEEPLDSLTHSGAERKPPPMQMLSPPS